MRTGGSGVGAAVPGVPEGLTHSGLLGIFRVWRKGRGRWGSGGLRRLWCKE